MIYNVLVFSFVIVCVLLVGMILLQSSESGGLGTAMGGQAINAAFGGQGADKLLVKITTWLAVAFMSLALLIGWMHNPASDLDAGGSQIKYSQDSSVNSSVSPLSSSPVDTSNTGN